EKGRTVAAERLEAIARASQRMDARIKHLVDAASLEGGGEVPRERRSVDAGEQLRSVIAESEPVATGRNIQLVHRECGDPPLVNADRLRVSQALSNLIGNAMKFTEAGGTVEVSVQPVDGAARFRVADTGNGIAPAELAHVFDAFWQAGPKERGSAGLGLTIARGIEIGRASCRERAADSVGGGPGTARTAVRR